MVWGTHAVKMQLSQWGFPYDNDGDDDDDDSDDGDDQDIPGNPDLPTTLPPYNQPLHPPISSQATLYHPLKQINSNAKYH